MLSVGGALLVVGAICLCQSLGRWLIRQRRKCFNAFDGTGVPTVPLRSLISGNTNEFWEPTVIERIDEWVKGYGNVFGFFIGDTPFMVVKDLDMINEIFIKEANKFSSRGRMSHMAEQDPLFAKYLIFSKGSVWKRFRNCMSQFFTSSKLRAVMPSLLHAQKQFIDVLGEHADRGVDVDINSLCERFTFDVISKAAYGIDTGVQRNPDHPLFKSALPVLANVTSGFFYHLGQNLYHWDWLLKLAFKVIGAISSNPLAEMTKKVTEVIRYRRKHPQVRVPDMAQILLDGLVEGEVSEVGKYDVSVDNTAPLPQETLNQLSSNCMAIFIGGYDTTRMTLTFWFYLMGRYPEVQEKMRQEVLDAFETEGDHLSLRTVTTLPYSNQVISETLRLYPPVIIFTSRCADEDYRCGKYVIKKGTSVLVPTYQLHHDPQYWKEPEKFDPERFSPENKSSINSTAYQPFGLGPRICIGQRLALVELVSAAAQTLRHYRIVLGKSQKRDLEIGTYSVMAAPKEKVLIRLHRLKGVN
ncbi:cytochrome P450 3A6-like isoform X1 [Dermacentor albipictus]|uniref:cytochrome P450 3A6-like isoform X1 n=1 Tax=Dermacentor albipictus TaxID=60249 RepID=UPI0031FBD106